MQASGTPIDDTLRERVGIHLRKLTARTASLPDDCVEFKWRVDFPGLLLFTLRDVLGVPDSGPDLPEKTRWIIDVEYDGVPFSFEHRKFGLTVVTPREHPEGSALTAELLKKLQKAIAVVERRLEVFAEEQAGRAAVTIANRFYYLDAGYRFLRSAADKSYAAAERAKQKPPRRGLKPNVTNVARQMASRWNAFANKNEEAGHLAAAAVNAYFSRTEHALVLALPFSQIDPSSRVLLDFMGEKKWSEKLKLLINVSDPRAARLCERVRLIRERLRNPTAHGGFEGRGGSLYFHLPRIGALPAQADRFASAFLLPRAGFMREFPRSARIDWDRVFDIKQHWGASASAIVRRAHDLRLIDAAQYQQAHKHMAWRRWSKVGEPYEPAVEEPETVRFACEAMRASFGETAAELASKLGWSRDVLQTVVCFALPDEEPEEGKGALVFLDARRPSEQKPSNDDSDADNG